MKSNLSGAVFYLEVMDKTKVCKHLTNKKDIYISMDINTILLKRETTVDIITIC